jgi:hypothetical protein
VSRVEKISQELDPLIEELRIALRNAQRDLARQKRRTDDLVQATIRAAFDATLAQGPLPRPKPPKLRKVASGREEFALVHMTDWQGAKVTTTYNSEIMKERVGRFVEKTEEICSIQRTHHPVNDIGVLFGGDMVEGLFNFPTQPHEIDQTIFGQYVTVAQLIAASLLQYAASFETVKVWDEWGNHGRIGSKRDAVPRSDNIDRMSYHLARALTAHEPRIQWREDAAEDIVRVEIGNYRALLLHGDEVGRNGFASRNTIVQHVNRWRSGSYPWEFRDVYIGHYHTHYEESMANGLGAIYGTGSTESDNRYAREQLAASAIPSQRLHFIDPEAGRVTSQYKIWLD